MNQRLVELMKAVITREGNAGIARLSLAAERRERMIDRYIKGTSKPSKTVAYNLAIACGCHDLEAQVLANEHSSEARTA